MQPEISLVLVSYNMTAQLRRTLMSLAPAYQRNCPPGRCEVIVVDNGSAVAPTLEEIATPGLDITLHAWRDAPHSPVPALNFGIAQATAPIIAVWIDAARLATPGLIEAYLRACRLHPNPVVASYNYHLGAKPQYHSVAEGYDEATEAELLASIDWPNDGYRLFDISVLEVGQSWPGPMLESNALCLPRASWKALGGYEARFSSPGGGAANPDMFSRACALPDVQLIKIANEGTFHQVHGGIATNATDHAIFRKLALEYMKIRKKPLAPVRQPGWLFDPRTDLVTRP
ncbi:glycosyltransferase [Ancylobacter sonchi]|uniref:glycosyltransferase family 2 protein n=1 Tax=Ancylobacter sonchi TaxID=1937790 RepID=UPI001BD38A99|nr:glycosyltransferase [Ancylobacter sonchi]MBS7534935.1 glycosyltransferase [Ancylobacter sonchi]